MQIKIYVDVFKVQMSLFITGLIPNPMTGVLIKREKFGHKAIDMEGRSCDIEAEIW